jgi:hypothetical protein
MTELIQSLILSENKFQIEELAGSLENIATLAGQLKDCTSFESLRNLLREIAEEACYTAKDIEENFGLDDD